MTITQVKGNEHREGMVAGEVKRREGIQEIAERWGAQPRQSLRSRKKV